MDVNQLFRAAERKCGRVLRVLPKKEIGSPRQYLMQVLKDETLPTLDICFPYQIKKTFVIESLINCDFAQDSYYNQAIDDRYAAYRIPLEVTNGQEIMSIKDLVPSTQISRESINDGYVVGSTVLGFRNITGPNRYGRYSSANVYEAVSMAQLEYVDKMLMGNVQSQFRYYFYQPNILMMSRQYATRGGQYSATFNLKNDPNLVTIPDTAFDAVKKLFILDVKAAIFGEYGIFGEIDTPDGPISLGISEWSGAEAERNDLEMNYRSKAHIRNTSMRSG